MKKNHKRLVAGMAVAASLLVYGCGADETKSSSAETIIQEESKEGLTELESSVAEQETQPRETEHDAQPELESAVQSEPENTVQQETEGFTGEQQEMVEELTAEELQKFTEFINHMSNNGFLMSEYTCPEEVDLTQVLYNGAGMELLPLSEEEREAYLAEAGFIETDILRLPSVQVDAFVQEKLGISLEEVQEKPDGVYLAEYDIYVFQHGDTNYAPFTCIGGSRTANGYELIFRSDWSDLPDCRVTLEETEGNYRFVSNQYQETETAGQLAELQQTEASQQTAATVDTTGIAPELLQQLETFVRYRGQWLFTDEYGPQSSDYAVYDMDADGRLELMTHTLMGSGLYSENHFYQVTEDGTEIYELGQEYYAEYAELDIGVSGFDTQIYRDMETSVVYYVAADVTRNGYAENYISEGAYYLQDGTVYSIKFRDTYNLIDENDNVNSTYYDAEGNEITEDAWEQLYQEFCSGKELLEASISWKSQYAEETAQASEQELLQMLIESYQEGIY